MGEALLFWGLASMCTICAFFVVFHKNPVMSALFLVGSFFALAGLYVELSAPFLAALQIIVYAGAIMVLFVFVIMLLNLQKDQERFSKSAKKFYRWVILFATFWILFTVIRLTAFPQAQAKEVGYTVQSLATLLFTKYSFPFELASYLLLMAMIGGVILAKKK